MGGQAGVLDIPEGVDILFTDEGAGFVHGGPLLSKYAVGLYYHTAMLNGQVRCALCRAWYGCCACVLCGVTLEFRHMTACLGPAGVWLRHRRTN